MKKFESSGIVTENPFEIELIGENGHLNPYYLLKGEAREKMTLSDLVNEQIDFVEQNCETKDENRGESAQIASSGDLARIGSSGNADRIGSSGHHVQIGSIGDYAHIASSGYDDRIGSSGYHAQIGSSGCHVQIGSSGDLARIASGGDADQIGSSGCHAQIGFSGDYAQIETIGDYARIGSSGCHAQIDSSGCHVQIASSGYRDRIELSGCDGVAFACGHLSAIKAKKDTWISLCEHTANVDGILTPSFALSAQIGNPEYTDCFGDILSEDNFYILKNKKFTPVILDGAEIVAKEK